MGNSISKTLDSTFGIEEVDLLQPVRFVAEVITGDDDLGIID